MVDKIRGQYILICIIGDSASHTLGKTIRNLYRDHTHCIETRFFSSTDRSKSATYSTVVDAVNSVRVWKEGYNMVQTDGYQ